MDEKPSLPVDHPEDDYEQKPEGIEDIPTPSPMDGHTTENASNIQLLWKDAKEIIQGVSKLDWEEVLQIKKKLERIVCHFTVTESKVDNLEKSLVRELAKEKSLINRVESDILKSEEEKDHTLRIVDDWQDWMHGMQEEAARVQEEEAAHSAEQRRVACEELHQTWMNAQIERERRYREWEWQTQDVEGQKRVLSTIKEVLGQE
jgi:hypothetical protein